MKTFKNMALGLGLVVTVLAGNPGFAASTSELLQQGLYAEEVEGNLDTAIQNYGQVISNRAAPKNQIAQALYRQGMCYLKKKDEAAARADLERLVTEYTNQTELVEQARPVLEDLTNFDPATLMPASTLAYVELGNPGRQIETVLAMLKGSPFENPLAAMGGSAGNGDNKSPEDIVGALLNPSMTAEFKKVRGLAFGVTGLANNHPPCIAVLYPGKSDALRGLALAGLGMAGKPGPNLAGMQTIKLPDELMAAYDDKVILLAQPAAQLEWCVKQYRGMISEPTLASANSSFATVPKAQRQKNALTVWGNVAGLYSNALALFPNDIPDQIKIANAFVDFPGMDQFILTHAIETDRVSFQADLRFKTNHHCLVYDLVRTPHISQAGLAGVPAEAIALASFSLSQADAPRDEKIRAGIQNLTGLDIGRELFANLEQVTLFLLPPDLTAFSRDKNEALLSRLGLALTSHNPKQTRQLLQTLLTANAQAQRGDLSRSNRYPIRIGDRQHTCCLEQVEENTLLSLSEPVLQAAAAAVKQHQSVCVSGPLHDAVAALNPAASKLILVNNAFLGLWLAPAAADDLTAAQRAELDDCFAQYSRAAAATTLELSTTEQPDQLALKTSLNHLPPLKDVIAPLMKMNELADAARAAAETKQLRQQAPASFPQISTAPTIDGQAEDLWSQARIYPITKKITDSAEKPNPLSAQFRGLWNSNDLYLLIEVTDGILHRGQDLNWYDNDSIELYLDAVNAKSESYSDTDYQFSFNWDPAHPELRERKHERTNGVEYALVTTDKGYNVEVKLPWATLQAHPAIGTSLGLELQVNDNRGSDHRDGKLAWQDQADMAWRTPRAFGNAELAAAPGLIGWWKFDETAGTTASDSSGGHHDGTLTGNAKWSPGRLGGALELDGHQGFVRIADKAAFDLTGQFTLAAWVKVRSVPGDWMTIISKGDTAWRLSTWEREPRFHFGLSQGSTFLGSAECATAVNPNEWHHVAATFDGGLESIYLDGRLEATHEIGEAIGTNDFEVQIGNNAQETERCFDGFIDDVRVYNYALPAAQIEAVSKGKSAP